MNVLPIIAAAALMAGATKARERPPFLSGQWTVQQKEDGKLSSGYHVLHLLCCYERCSTTGCSLTFTTLNQCHDLMSGGSAFYPKVERYSTDEGALSVAWLPDGRANLTITVTGLTTKLAIAYSCSGDKAFPLCTITDASGGFVKDSVILNRVVAVEYVTVRSNSGVVYRRLDCDAALPALPKPADQPR